MSIENPEVLRAELEQNPPEAFIRCRMKFPDKRGNIKYKSCILNLKTGDVMRRRKINWHERMNFAIVRRSGGYHIKSICHNAFQKAQIVDANIVLTTWVYADNLNYPHTSEVPCCLYGELELKDPKQKQPVNSEAYAGIILSPPKIAAMVVIGKDKQVMSWEDDKNYGIINERNSPYCKAYLSQALLNSIYHTYDTRRVVGLTESFKKLFNVGYIGANKYITFDNYQDVALFMKAKPMEKKNNEHQRLIDELSSIALTTHNIEARTEKTVCYADRANSEWVVLRWYHKVGQALYAETSRMYVNKNEAIHCRSNLCGDWIYAHSKIKATTFNADVVVRQTDDVFDGTKLEYFKNIATKLSNQSAALYMLTMYPEFEKLCKADMMWLCESYLTAYYQTSWKAHLKDYVGEVKWSAKNINTMIGVNRHQIEKINEFRAEMAKKVSRNSWQYRYIDTIIFKLKRIFGVTSLSSIDDATFDYIVDSFKDEDKLIGMYSSALTITFEMYPKNALYFIKDLNAAMAQCDGAVTVTEGGCRSQMRVDRLYFDTVSMIQTGNYTDVLKPRFSSIEELIGHHNIMVDLINANAAQHERRMIEQFKNGFQTNLERWKKWEWDEDETFCVIAPTEPLDIAVEGITLRHCVKSYIPSVANGSTNIMFIRQKGKEKDPFFTVEVDRSNNIRQVHGMCNSNTSSVEGLTEFVKKWSKAKKLKYSQEYANGCRIARG